MVIQLSTRGTVDSDNWFLQLPDRACCEATICRIMAERL
jgi:hypothetical protein